LKNDDGGAGSPLLFKGSESLKNDDEGKDTVCDHGSAVGRNRRIRRGMTSTIKALQEFVRPNDRDSARSAPRSGANGRGIL